MPQDASVCTKATMPDHLSHSTSFARPFSNYTSSLQFPISILLDPQVESILLVLSVPFVYLIHSLPAEIILSFLFW